MINLKELRKETNITQKELAKALGYTQTTISKWEQGLRLPDADNIIKLCKYFNVTSDYLLGLKDL